MEKISKEVALKEVQKWLDYKKVDVETIDDIDKQIDALALSISKGYLVLTKDFSWEHNLKFPIEKEGGAVACSKLVYKPRLKLSEVERATERVDMKSSFQLIRAYITALTGQNSGIIKNLDTADQKIATAIALFFL